VALGVDAVVQLAKAHIYLPADRLPGAAGRAELRRLRALVAIGARDAERGDARVAEGEDDLARRDFANRLVVRSDGPGDGSAPELGNSASLRWLNHEAEKSLTAPSYDSKAAGLARIREKVRNSVGWTTLTIDE
jgi:hypothetical protein